MSSDAAGQMALWAQLRSRLMQQQRRSVMMWSAPFVGFLSMIIFRRQVCFGLRQVISLLHGEDLKSKQNSHRLARFKKVLFESLVGFKSVDPELRRQGKLRVLELNPGTGSNIEYYPPGTLLTVVEPKPLLKQIFQDRRHEFPAHVTLDQVLITTPEDLSAIPDGSVDVIVATLVLCSVEDLRQTITEIKRVLAKGGRYYFVEHEKYPDNSWAYTLQQTVNPLWKFCNDGCDLIRPLSMAFEYTGFVSRSMKVFQPPEIPFLIRPLVVGYVTK